MGLLRNMIIKYKMRKSPVKYLRSIGVTIGDNVEIYPTANFGTEPYLISIGDNVRINEGVQLFTHDGGVWVVRNMFEKYKDIDTFGKIIVGNNVHIGTNAMVLPGVHVGNNCIIGCGAVVTKDIPDNSIAVGVPARVVETLDEYIEKNKQHYLPTKYLSAEGKKATVLKTLM